MTQIPEGIELRRETEIIKHYLAMTNEQLAEECRETDNIKNILGWLLKLIVEGIVK